MQVDNKKTQSSISEFPEDAFLIFIGHSDDATAEAHAIYDLQGRLEKDFRTFLKTNHESPFKSLMLWEWQIDASSKPGGQNVVVTPVLHRAQIIIFVFKERVGSVTSEEIENARELSKYTRINILAFFPAYHPESSKINNKIGARDWANLKELYDKLTEDWSAEDSTSVTPCLPLYADIDDLKNIALEKLRDAMRDIIADIKCIKVPKHSTTYSSKRIIGYIKDISFDRRPVLIHMVEELDKVLIEKFLSTEDSLKELPQAKHSSSIEERLAILGCVMGSRPTLGAFLCFAPSRLIIDKFSSCSLQVVRFKGVSRTLSKVEKFSMHDNLLNLFDQGINWLTSEAHLGRQGRVGSTDRDDLEIPKIALREALANALVHRDYEDAQNRDQPTRVEVFDNRIEITSFGTLPGSVNIDQLNQYSDTLRPVRRNPIIADIFQHITHVELNASGISRMRYAMQQALLPPPKIHIQNGAVVVCFTRPIFIDSNTRQPIELRKRALIGGSLSGLDAYRTAAFAVCLRSGYFPVMMEHHPNTQNDEDDAITLSNTMVDYADIYIGILTNQYGYVPDTHEKSITEIEYYRVKARKEIPRLLFSLNQKTIENDTYENESSSQKQLNFIETVTRESLVHDVCSADELRDKLNGLIKLENNSPLESREYEHRYQRALKTELGTISLLGTHALENIQVTLTDTFVSLRISDTWRTDMRWNPKVPYESLQEERIRNPEEVMSLVFETCRILLVIGDPGSGKTTLLKHYALSCLENEDYTTLGFNEPVLVFYLPLRELIKSGVGYDTLPANLFAWSEKHSLGIAETVFFDWLHNRQTLLLLDGLDEISEPEQRIKACDWIDRVVTGFEKANVVVTSRYTGYRKGDGIELRSHHVRADIMDFSPEQQKEFLEKWFSSVLCRELRPGFKSLQEWTEEQKRKAAEKAATIIAFLEREENRGLRLLAAVPMLLQIMAILWKERQYLPKTRSELFNAAVNYLLDYRDRQKEIAPLLSAEDARRVLMPVSLWMQEELQKDEADKALMQKEMQKHLKTLNKPPSVEMFCANLIDRAGLLVAYGDNEYRFRHKLFREYMAGIQLEKKMHSFPGYLNTLVNNFGKDWWEEPLRFYISEVDADAFDAFMAKLFDAEVSATFNQKQQDLLITFIEEARQTKTDALQNKLLDLATTTNRQRYIMQCLKAIGTADALDAVRKFLDAPFEKKAEVLDFAFEIAGVTKQLSLGSKRDRYGSKDTILSDKLGAHYILIKGGSFTFSLTKRQESVPDFFVAKYTVTNQHYRRFINYLDSKEAGYASILPVETYIKSLFDLAKSINGFSDFVKGEKSLATRFRCFWDDNNKFNKDDQPVIELSWYAARAYCLWLSLLESERGDTNLYRLPTEKEWEYAAGGKESRTYPWGDKEPSVTLANYNNNESSTTPSGRYPEGATHEGLYDMAGNVWEWTADLYSQDENWRSLRGGDFNTEAGALSCYARKDRDPSIKSYSIVGFRVIRSCKF